MLLSSMAPAHCKDEQRNTLLLQATVPQLQEIIPEKQEAGGCGRGIPKPQPVTLCLGTLYLYRKMSGVFQLSFIFFK